MNASDFQGTEVVGAPTVAKRMLDLMEDEGVSHVFGNPGTTEMPFVMEVARRSSIEYVLALHEGVAVSLADGYAAATGRPGVLNLHAMPGLGNAIGQLSNAMVTRTPLVVTAGQQDSRHLLSDPWIGGDLVALARPVCKSAHEARCASEVLPLMRRAFREAMTHPRGPVFVSIPMDFLAATHADEIPARSHVLSGSVASGAPELAARLAAIAPGRLAIVACDDVAHADAQSELLALALALQCQVFGAPMHSRNLLPARHALWGGTLPIAAEGIAKTLAAFDWIFVVGVQPFPALIRSEISPVPPATRLLQLCEVADGLARYHPVELGMSGGIKATLAALREGVGEPGPSGTEQEGRKNAEIERLESAARDRYDTHPLHPMAAAHAVLRSLPPETIVVDEAITTGAYVRGFHHPEQRGRYFFNRGGGLGWGMAAACGLSLGSGRAPVLCITGDGSALYGPQALWTAARERLPVLFCVMNNRQYLILKRQQELDARIPVHPLDIDQPAIDFVAMAASYGVAATRVERVSEIRKCIEEVWDRAQPHLMEIRISSR